MSVFQLAPGDDPMFSLTYSLSNYIAATSRFSGVDDERFHSGDGRTNRLCDLPLSGVRFKDLRWKRRGDCCEHDLGCGESDGVISYKCLKYGPKVEPMGQFVGYYGMIELCTHYSRMLTVFAVL